MKEEDAMFREAYRQLLEEQEASLLKPNSDEMGERVCFCGRGIWWARHWECEGESGKCERASEQTNEAGRAMCEGGREGMMEGGKEGEINVRASQQASKPANLEGRLEGVRWEGE